jgi:8-oxo-dGTP pyrophosphatase MutT (NUDIX family)
MKQFKPKYRKAVFIVAYRKEKGKFLYLLLKRKLHWIGWEFPKGGIEKYEHMNRTVRRELFEETGQFSKDIKPYPVSGKYRYHKFLRDRPGFMGQSYKLFSGEIKNKIVKIDKREHSTYKWVSYKEAIKNLTWESQRKCLSIVNNYITKKK